MNPREFIDYEKHHKANNNNGNNPKTSDYESILKMMCALDAIVVTKWYGYSHQREILVFNKHGTIAFNFYDEDLLDIVPGKIPFEEWAATEFVLENTTDNIVTIYR